jgi:hypothetical protein
MAYQQDLLTPNKSQITRLYFHYNVPWVKEARAPYKTVLKLSHLQSHSAEKYKVDIQKHRLWTL